MPDSLIVAVFLAKAATWRGVSRGDFPQAGLVYDKTVRISALGCSWDCKNQRKTERRDFHQCAVSVVFATTWFSYILTDRRFVFLRDARDCLKFHFTRVNSFAVAPRVCLYEPLNDFRDWFDKSESINGETELITFGLTHINRKFFWPTSIPVPSAKALTLTIQN